MRQDREALLGIHHVTAIAGDPQANVDFYVGVLGLRLVKRSVNQDDPGTYHLFYADAVGHPGTDLTFFPWPGARRGRAGAGQTIAVALAVPPESLGYWTRRLTDHGVACEGPARRLGEEVVALSDPDGMPVELVAGPDTGTRTLWTPWEDGPVPPEHAVRGLHAVTLLETAVEPTRTFLVEVLGAREVGDGDGRLRFATGAGGSGAMLDLIARAGAAPGRIAAGSIHHVAWRTADAGTHRGWWERLRGRGIPVSSIIDRFWFTSIYFHEPGGALFEIATDGPGFTVDERAEALGSRLILPPWLEGRRAEIERVLPPLRVPAPARRGPG
ncbi:MAG: ring-cleaving dioxygenase [Armatimonadota bacterium]|nr:ring-cleaving dioxygenase [Armatimonadota bacterium]MDR7421430.1 ring-cleaving dioxygenase [Armatimonadota bacterium]MDR7454971.1 ring-cleaving dioxygenase [Armatimonadota bacterium]MDR7456082.1 ring-cleaving dioxygenase [Armatimonadota bacterium]MDR7495356.1 ring-cleaving dioxygenase [Armatimonadota bacterium]